MIDLIYLFNVIFNFTIVNFKKNTEIHKNNKFRKSRVICPRGSGDYNSTTDQHLRFVPCFHDPQYTWIKLSPPFPTLWYIMDYCSNVCSLGFFNVRDTNSPNQDNVNHCCSLYGSRPPLPAHWDLHFFFLFSSSHSN